MILVVQPKYGGMIIDIVSREIRTPEEQGAALDAIKDTILDIVLIVVIGYDILLCLQNWETMVSFDNKLQKRLAAVKHPIRMNED